MNGSAGPPALEVRTISDEPEWDRLKPDWSGLFEANPAAAPPLHFDWMRTWWRVYGPRYARPGGLRIVTAWRGSLLVGVLPLYQAATRGSEFALRRLRFLSSGEAADEETCADYLDLLCRPGEEADCARAARKFLEGSDWDHLGPLDLPETSPLLGANGLAARGRVVPSGECPVANLQGGFDAYLQRLSAGNRQQARRLLRDADRSRAVFELAGEPQAEEFFADLVRLHQERWVAAGKPGCFASARFTEFHRAIARQWLTAGRAVLARLSVAGQPVAVIYGFVTGSKFDFYQSGVRIVAPGLRSAGNLAHLMLMQALARRGVAWYDFLRGPSAYKDRLATDRNRLVSLEVWRPTLRAVASRAVRGVRRAIEKGLGRLRRSQPPSVAVP